MRVYTVLCLLFLSGCVGTADLIKRNYTPTKSGVVRYQSQGIHTMQKARRKAAHEQMVNFCGGKYDITSQNEGSTPGGFVQDAFNPQLTHAVSTDFTYIDFVCTKQASTQ